MVSLMTPTAAACIRALHCSAPSPPLHPSHDPQTRPALQMQRLSTELAGIMGATMGSSMGMAFQTLPGCVQACCCLCCLLSPSDVPQSVMQLCPNQCCKCAPVSCSSEIGVVCSPHRSAHQSQQTRQPRTLPSGSRCEPTASACQLPAAACSAMCSITGSSWCTSVLPACKEVACRCLA